VRVAIPAEPTPSAAVPGVPTPAGAAPAANIPIIRSSQRRRTITLREKDGRLEVLAPADMSDAKLAPIIENLLKRRERRHTKQALDDSLLEQRARQLNGQYFEGKLAWRSIAWVANQDKRWGSCTPSTGEIRLSHRLAELPDWVRDYVIVHELAHLLEANHGPRFWHLVNRYPRTERARGYLMALSGEQGEEEM
jgi:predicted metal-dependent hydrolase